MVSVTDWAAGPDRGGPGGLHQARVPGGPCDRASSTGSLTSCPACGVPAEIVERFMLGSTDGPIEHVCLTCVGGHCFRMPADRLPPEPRPPAGAPDLAPGTRASNSGVGFSRLPGTLGTVANA
jgi:hypothetical protein